jgi:hypothetical protein
MYNRESLYVYLIVYHFPGYVSQKTNMKLLFVYQGPKSAPFSSESGLSSRGVAETSNSRGQKALFGRGSFRQTF